MKNVFAKDNVVVGIVSIFVEGVTSSPRQGAVAYEVADDIDVDIGYTVSRPGNVTTFSPPELRV